MPVTRKHTTRATSLNLADLPALSGCFGRITRHSERAAADRPERDQERETRQGLENHMSEKSPTVPGAGQQRPRRPLDGTGVYPANLCPLSSGVDFACLGEDFGQSVGESIKAAPGRAVWQGTPEHLDGVLREQEGIGNTIQACTG